MTTRLTKFKASDYLKTEEDWAFLLSDALESNDAAYIAQALGAVAKAKGMSGVARSARLSRESLYKALSGKGNPEFETILRVLKAVGLKLVAAPVAAKRPRKAAAARRRKAA